MFDRTVKRIVYTLCSLVFIILTICSFVSVYVNEFTKDLSNYIWLYLLLFVTLFVVFFLFLKFVDKTDKTKIIYVIYIILIFVIPLLLVSIASQTKLEYDPNAVFEFTYESLQGDYHQVFKGNYMSVYTWQYGYALFQTLILKIANFVNEGIIYNKSACTTILFYVNAILSSASILFGFLSVKTISNKNNKTVFSYMFLSLLCIPFFLYCLYLYTDVPSITFLMISSFLYIKFTQHNNLKYLLLSTVFVSIACMIKFSSFVFAIAFAIVSIYKNIVEKRNIVLSLLSLILIIMPVLSYKLPIKHYEMVSNYNNMVDAKEHAIDDGCPIELNIAMGLDVDSNMYGWYTGKSLHTCLDICYQDRACEINKANEYISSSLKTMSSNIPLTLDFFSKKIISQWGDGTMESFYSTKIIGESVDRTMVNFLYKGNSNIFLYCLAKAHLILINILSLLFIYIKRKPSHLSITDFTLEVIVLGGFILSLFWESNSRYNLPYLYVLVMLASINSNYLFNFINNKIKSLKLKHI